ncbi:MAG: SIMPL domain-containing protein [bacterium]
MKHWIVAITLISLSAIAIADDDKKNRIRDQVSLTAEATEQVDNDTIVAVLYAQQEGNDPTALAAKVNNAVQWAITQAGKHKDIEVKTQSYNTQPVYQKSRLSGWRVRQSIELKSQNTPLLSQLIGDLQARLSVQSVDYKVSDKLRLEVEDRLIAKAIAAFEARAKLVKKTMGREGYRLVDMNIMTSSPAIPRPQYRMAMAAEESVAKAPAILAGKRKLVVNIQGKIQLTRD